MISGPWTTAANRDAEGYVTAPSTTQLPCAGVISIIVLLSIKYFCFNNIIHVRGAFPAFAVILLFVFFLLNFGNCLNIDLVNWYHVMYGVSLCHSPYIKLVGRKSQF